MNMCVQNKVKLLVVLFNEKKSMIEIRNQRRRNRSKRDNMAHSERPRLVIYRSNKNISAQVVNDHDGVTLASASSLDKDIEKDVEKAKSKTEISKLIGTVVAERALGKKIGKVVFDGVISFFRPRYVKFCFNA